MAALRHAGAITTRSRRAGNRALDRAEAVLLRADRRPLASPPILILGAPRCGSTLLAQVMIGCLDVSYLSNLHCALHGSPALAERLVRLGPRPAMVYESRHGATSGWLAPSECGPFWYRFFRRNPQRVAPAEADPRSMARLRASVAAFQAAAGRPIVFKNLICSLRVAATARALPEALFVVVHRDLLANARSLLAARLDVTGSYERWWSAQPPGYEALVRLPPEEQVVGQIRGVAATIAADRAEVGGDRFVDVHYEQLCADPAAVVRSVCELAGAHGHLLRRLADPPAAFPPPRRADLDPELDARLTRAVTA
jgi:Sulfotransferase family